MKKVGLIINPHPRSNEMSEQYCVLCKEPIEPIAADPSRWGIDLPTPSGQGKGFPHHIGCVVERVYGTKPSEQLQQLARTIQGKPLKDYLYEQFPATRGHIPLLEYLDASESAADLRKTIEQLKLNSPKCAACAEALWCGGVTSANEHTCHGDLRREVEELKKQLEQSDACRQNNADSLGYAQTCLNNKVAENEKLRSALSVQEEYSALLGAEIEELAPFTAIHGWKSTRYDKGVELRAKLAALKPA